MSEAEKYINEHTNYRSNFKPNGYHEWVTPDDALRACEIIKQETIKKTCKWLESLSGYVVCGQKANVENLLRVMEE